VESLSLSRLAKQPKGLGLDSDRLGTTLPPKEAGKDSGSSDFVPVSVKDISVNNARACYAAKKSRKANKINAQSATSVLEITKERSLKSRRFC